MHMSPAAIFLNIANHFILLRKKRISSVSCHLPQNIYHELAEPPVRIVFPGFCKPLAKRIDSVWTSHIDSSFLKTTSIVNYHSAKVTGASGTQEVNRLLFPLKNSDNPSINGLILCEADLCESGCSNRITLSHKAYMSAQAGGMAYGSADLPAEETRRGRLQIEYTRCSFHVDSIAFLRCR